MENIKINKSAVILLFKILGLILFIDLIVIITLIIDYMNMVSDNHSAFSLEEYFFIFILLIQIIVVIFIFIKWIFKYFVFKNNKLIYYSGIIFKRKQEFILDKIGCVNFEQSFFGKIFNYGNIIIYIQNDKFSLKGISNPNGFIRLLENNNK